MHSGYIRHETFSFMMSLPAMSLGLRFCVVMEIFMPLMATGDSLTDA